MNKVGKHEPYKGPAKYCLEPSVGCLIKCLATLTSTMTISSSYHDTVSRIIRMGEKKERKIGGGPPGAKSTCETGHLTTGLLSFATHASQMPHDQRLSRRSWSPYVLPIETFFEFPSPPQLPQNLQLCIHLSYLGSNWKMNNSNSAFAWSFIFCWG